MAKIRNHRVRLSVAVLAGLTLSACGSSDGGGGSDTAAFCEQVRDLDAADDAESDDITAAAGQLEALIDDAPAEIKDDLQTLVDAFSALDDLDENDPDAFAQLLAVFEDPAVVEASDNLEAFGVEECGLEPSSDGGGNTEETEDPAVTLDVGDATDGDATDGDATDGAGSDGEVADGEVKPTTVPGDPYDEEFWGPIDPDEISIPGVKQHIDVNYPDSGWYEGAISGWSLSGDSIVANADVEPDEAVLICGAVLEYAGAISPDVDVRVDTGGGDPLAAGSVADGCAAI